MTKDLAEINKKLNWVISYLVAQHKQEHQQWIARGLTAEARKEYSASL